MKEEQRNVRKDEEVLQSAKVKGQGTTTSGKKLSLKNIFLGDFLINDFLRRQALWRGFLI